jgi:hypothetical protein
MKGSIYFLIGILILLSWIIIGVVIQKDDVIINETDTHITVKEYRMYNADSVINVYKKPIRYEGTVSDKYRRTRRVNGHTRRSYYIVVKYNDKEHTLRGREYYNTYEKGNKVIVEEKFYPIEEINLYKKNN